MVLRFVGLLALLGLFHGCLFLKDQDGRERSAPLVTALCSYALLALWGPGSYPDSLLFQLLQTPEHLPWAQSLVSTWTFFWHVTVLSRRGRREDIQ